MRKYKLLSHIGKVSVWAFIRDGYNIHSMPASIDSRDFVWAIWRYNETI